MFVILSIWVRKWFQICTITFVLWSFNLWIVSLGLVCIWPFEFHIFISILYSNGGFMYICERCFNLAKVFQVWSMEGYEIERERKRVRSKERRSHHRRWWLWWKLSLLIWACFRERPPLGRVFFYLYFFNKLCLVARKGRKVNNGVTILLIDLLGQNLIMFSLFFGF